MVYLALLVGFEHERNCASYSSSGIFHPIKSLRNDVQVSNYSWWQSSPHDLMSLVSGNLRPRPRRAYRIVNSVQLFGGKEGSHQFRWLLKHYREDRLQWNRMITEDIDWIVSSEMLAAQAQAQAQAQTLAQTKPYFIIQVVEGTNST